MSVLLTYAIRFLVGGITVAGVSLIAQLSPHISGFLAAFPAVFLTALILVRVSDGPVPSVHFAQGGIQGVVGTLATVFATLAALLANWPWLLAMICGLAAYGTYAAYVVLTKTRRP
jgi:hypothetical protein